MASKIVDLYAKQLKQDSNGSGTAKASGGGAKATKDYTPPVKTSGK